MQQGPAPIPVYRPSYLTDGLEFQGSLVESPANIFYQRVKASRASLVGGPELVPVVVRGGHRRGVRLAAHPVSAKKLARHYLNSFFNRQPEPQGLPGVTYIMNS